MTRQGMKARISHIKSMDIPRKRLSAEYNNILHQINALDYSVLPEAEVIAKHDNLEAYALMLRDAINEYPANTTIFG